MGEASTDPQLIDTLLATKLFIPQVPSEFVPRSRLTELLDKGMERKLTLVSAPAGFGKTTLLSEWIHSTELPVAWLSLDDDDNDPARFFAYVVAAMQKLDSGIGQAARVMLQSAQLPPLEAIVSALINNLAGYGSDSTLVLDDYQLISSEPIQAAIGYLLEHMPSQFHLIIVTRADPSLLLARLRGRGELTELRAADLRFTPDEAATFLNQVMGLGLSAEEVTALETRTEGWIVGLQMAALSMQGRADTASFIQAFTGSHHFILDYLVEEVLQRQPERVRSFLLQTSILDRLSGPLCDAVTGQEDGRGMLEALEQGNLFVVPLDDKRQWYRYHHLFADVLHAHSMEEQPGQVPIWHRRASEWYEHNGSPSDAVRHALAAEDFERAAGLVELAAPAMIRSREETTFLGWLKALPDELVRSRPVLSVYHAFASFGHGELEAAEAHLRDAERWLEATADGSERAEAPSAEMVVVNEEEFRSLPARIANARALHAQILGDVPGTVKYARRALDLLPEGDDFWRGAAAGLLGLAYWASGDLEAAHRTYADGMASLQMAGDITLAISLTYVLPEIRMAQGRLHEAASTYQQSLQLAAAQVEPVLRGTADLYVGLSELHRERDDLEAASQHLLRSKELGEHAALPETPYRWCVAMARVNEAQGDLDGALDLLHEAERLYIRDAVPDLRPVAALKTRIRIAQGRLAEGLGWVRELGLSVEDDLSYLREFEHITLARVLLAQYKSVHADRAIREAMGLLERLLKAAEEGERTGSVIEILVLQALAHEAQGDIPLALAPLERALTLAELEGYVRIFVDEGIPMAQLLLEADARGIMPDFTGKLLAAFEAGEQQGKGEAHLSTPPPFQTLSEPLSQRELEVLQLIAEGLSNGEISERLFLALDTVKGHNRKIFGKLGVQSRTQAINKARALHILPPA